MMLKMLWVLLKVHRMLLRTHRRSGGDETGRGELTREIPLLVCRVLKVQVMMMLVLKMHIGRKLSNGVCWACCREFTSRYHHVRRQRVYTGGERRFLALRANQWAWWWKGIRVWLRLFG